MGRYYLTAAAEAQLGDILDWSERRFGEDARERYAALILAALRNVADDPHQPGVHWHRMRKIEIGVYHIEHSRDRVSQEVGRVGEPRHYMVFAVGAGGAVEVLGFAHDRMLLPRVFRKRTSGRR